MAHEVGNPNSSSSSSSAFARLCRKLSPKRSTSCTTSTPSSPSSPASPDNQKRILTGAGSDMERVFQYFDEDGDGKVSAGELLSCVRAAGGELSAREAETVVEGLDSDGDGLLGLEDFAKLMEAECGEEEELREAFGKYEMEGMGCITPKSLKRMLSRLGESRTIQECKAMIQAFDIDGDGVLSFDEFRVMMR